MKTITKKFEILLWHIDLLFCRQFIIKEYQFLKDRKFRFDYAIPKWQVAVEIEGGVYVRGAHTRPTRYISDCEKYNLAQLNGWIVIRYADEKQMMNLVSDIKNAVRLQILRGQEQLFEPITNSTPEKTVKTALKQKYYGKIRRVR